VGDAPFSNDPHAATTNIPSFNANATASQPTIDFRLNPLRKWPRIGWAIMGASLIVSASGFLIFFMLKGSGGRGPTPLAPTIGLIAGALALLVAAAGLSVALMTPRQVRRIDALFSGQNLLAHWTYSPDEWSRFLQAEFARVRRMRIGLLVLLLSVVAIAGLVVFISARRYHLLASNVEDPLVGVIGALMAFLLIALLIWSINYREVTRRRDIGAGSIYISTGGVLIGGSLESWDSMFGGGRLVRVAYERGDPDAILFRYSHSTGRGRDVKDVHVPVPRNHQADAERLIAYFNQGDARIREL
jgi:hypothetical protein